MFDLNALAELDIDALKNVKDEVNKLVKSKKDALKVAAANAKLKNEADADAAVRKLIDAGTIAAGSTISFKYKGNVNTAVVDKVGDKTFTVTLTEGKRYIKFASVLLG